MNTKSCKHNTTLKKIIKIVLRTTIILLFMVMLPILIISCHLFFQPDPAKPETTYGEFPFTLVYEIDGDTIMIKDTLIVEYKGVGANEGVGKYNKWNRYLKSGKIEGYIRQNIVLFDGLSKKGSSATVYFELGSCEYYMGLPEEMLYYYYTDMKPGDIVVLSSEFNGPINEKDLYEEFGIKIIKKEISPPTNTIDPLS